MRKVIVTVFFLMLSCLLLPSFALAGKYSFGDLNFGDSKDKVVSYLKEKYSAENISDSNSYVWLRNFEFGDKKVEVTFSFDHDAKLYSFQFQTVKVDADEFKFQLKDDAAYLTSIFTKRFGKPAKTFSPTLLGVGSGSGNFVSKWNDKDYDVYTGIFTYQFQYYAVAEITSKKMEKAFRAHSKKELADSSAKAADSF